MIYWKKQTHAICNEIISKALLKNVNFSQDASLGYPSSKLDDKVFYDDAPFLKDAPTLRAFVANPNNIGCHTIGTSEKAFFGTQLIENDVLNILAIDVFKAKPNSFDGYIASGGTEANIQAIWVYRNYFIKSYNAKINEIALVASEDTHYSIAKAANLLNIDWIKLKVNQTNRVIINSNFYDQIKIAKQNGKKYFIGISNLGTTMFGSVDNPDLFVEIFEANQAIFKLHIDAAYGGFVYPFSNQNSIVNFDHPQISSITIDAHKMLQAPYGTGIFICRKGYIESVLTKEAEYVEGKDVTLCGSRSGANAVAVWMILNTYGPHGWFEKISVLQMRTNFLCQQLDHLKRSYFREPYMNIVTIKF